MPHSYFKLVSNYRIPTVCEMRWIQYFWTDNPIDPDANTLNNIASHFSSHLMEVVSSGANLYRSDFYYLDAQHEWQPYSTVAQNINGSRVGEMLPPWIAAVIVGRTDHKRTIYRKFIGPCSESDQSGSLWTGAYTTAFTQPFAYLIAHPAYGGAAWWPGVFDQAWNFWPYKSLYLSPVVGTNRRRQIGHGI